MARDARLLSFGRFDGVPPRLTTSGWLRLAVLRRLLAPGVRTILEIGAGTGGLGSLLARELDYTGLEPDERSHSAAARLLGDRVLQLREEELAPATFDAVLAFEVLEHLEDDVAALRRWRSRVSPGGYLYLSVPTGRDRFGSLDVKAGHFRRYDRADLERALEEAGYSEPVIVNYGFPITNLLLAGMHVAARRSRVRHLPMEARTAASGRWLQPTRRTAAATRALAWPFELAQRPFAGTSLGTGFVSRARVQDA